MENTRYNRKDIAGKHIGRLTALYPTDKRDHKGTVVWHCRCDCGNEVDVSYDRLMYGRYYSCGCLRQEMLKAITQKLTLVDHTGIEWLESRKYRKDNSSGFRGVVQRKNGNYIVNIGFKQKRYYLGTYNSYDEAVEVRLKAEDLVHGGFLRACKRMRLSDNQSGQEDLSRLIYEVKKGDGYIEIESNDADENGRRMTFGDFQIKNG